VLLIKKKKNVKIFKKKFKKKKEGDQGIPFSQKKKRVALKLA